MKTRIIPAKIYDNALRVCNANLKPGMKKQDEMPSGTPLDAMSCPCGILTGLKVYHDRVSGKFLPYKDERALIDFAVEFDKGGTFGMSYETIPIRSE